MKWSGAQLRPQPPANEQRWTHQTPTPRQALQGTARCGSTAISQSDPQTLGGMKSWSDGFGIACKLHLIFGTSSLGLGSFLDSIVVVALGLVAVLASGVWWFFFFALVLPSFFLKAFFRRVNCGVAHLQPLSPCQLNPQALQPISAKAFSQTNRSTSKSLQYTTVAVPSPRIGPREMPAKFHTHGLACLNTSLNNCLPVHMTLIRKINGMPCLAASPAVQDLLGRTGGNAPTHQPWPKGVGRSWGILG